MSPRVRVLLGCVVAAMGAVWALQGAGVLPGSVMSGDPKWLIIGTAVAIGGGVIAYLGMRAGRS